MAFPQVDQQAAANRPVGTTDFTAQSASKAINIELSKIKKYEPQQAQDLITGLFSKRTNMDYKTTQTFIGKVDTSLADSRGEAERNMYTQINRPTLTPEVIDYRRRVNEERAEEISRIIPQLHAKKLGQTIEKTASEVKMAVEAALKRAKQAMALDLLLTTYLESPVIAGHPTGAGGNQRVRFPRSQYAVPLSYLNRLNGQDPYNAAGAGKSRLALSVETFMGIEAEFNNALGQTFNNKSGIDMSLGNVSRICIMSETGYAAFVNDNMHLLGNADFFGKGVAIQGYGQFRVLHGFVIVTLPDSAFEKVTGFGADGKMEALPGANVTALNAHQDRFVIGGTSSLVLGRGEKPAQYTKSPFYISGSGTNIAAGRTYLDGAGLYAAIFVERNAFMLYDVPQLDIRLQGYEDFTTSMEKKLFGQIPCEGMRHFDSLIRVVGFTPADRETSLKTAPNA